MHHAVRGARRRAYGSIHDRETRAKNTSSAAMANSRKSAAPKPRALSIGRKERSGCSGNIRKFYCRRRDDIRGTRLTVSLISESLAGRMSPIMRKVHKEKAAYKRPDGVEMS